MDEGIVAEILLWIILVAVMALLFAALFLAARLMDRREEERGAREAAQALSETMGRVREKLGALDDLSLQAGRLEEILRNPQQRGAFGEAQLEAIVLAALPKRMADFQAVLSNGKRVDCLLKLDDPPGPIGIDSKFPLKDFNDFREARDEDSKERARRGMRDALRRQIGVIGENYIVAGETAEIALLFVPSEAVYAEIHASLLEVVEESYRRRVYLVSPSTLMALLMTVRSVLRDVRMAEKADEIRDDVRRLGSDVEKLYREVERSETYFGHLRGAIDEMRKIGERIVRRVGKIGDIDGD